MYTNANSMRHHGDYRSVTMHRNGPTECSSVDSNTRIAATERVPPHVQHPRRGMVNGKLLSACQAERIETWNVRTLQGLARDNSW